ncbi:hypothetical protein BH10PSE2_BH10PSE2_26590 [soil metagenome]
MPLAHLRHRVTLAAAASAMVLASLVAGCSTPAPVVEAAAPPPVVAPQPPVTLNQGVAQAASIYVAFIRDVGTIRAGFPDAESIQVAMRRGAAYDPATLSRGMIAYASILALQSPEFVAGVRQYGVDPEQRQRMINSIIADPAYAATLPGADAAAGLIIATLGQDVTDLTRIADAVEADAYTIQERRDPRRAWAVTPIPHREVRLQTAKTISEGRMLPSAEESAMLFAAANTGSGLNLAAGRAAPPYTPPVANALAIAALAALGAGGDNYRAYTDNLAIDPGNEFCLSMSKLNLFQCLAASRPSYEDMFCVGRHVVRDLATCASGSTRVATVSVSDPTATAGPGSGSTASLNQSAPAGN